MWCNLFNFFSIVQLFRGSSHHNINIVETTGVVLLQGAQLSHAVKGPYGGVCRQEHKERSRGSRWAEAKKYKTRPVKDRSQIDHS